MCNEVAEQGTGRNQIQNNSGLMKFMSYRTLSLLPPPNKNIA